ncbi:hypothetical protein WMY93_023234 [Mugilogobius chulae]|uniref:Uncharacterized protein n=1 Tax=Mugilogobius chulae TaxID=88201 RepID=A0AAW0N6R9_9GOBI
MTPLCSCPGLNCPASAFTRLKVFPELEASGGAVPLSCPVTVSSSLHTTICILAPGAVLHASVSQAEVQEPPAWPHLKEEMEVLGMRRQEEDTEEEEEEEDEETGRGGGRIGRRGGHRGGGGGGGGRGDRQRRRR